MQPSYTQSSEELFITNFLEEKEFKFEKEVVLNNLKDDDKTFRRADFYLTNYKIYVEYFGNYNATKERRAEYDKKVQVYLKNGIPTVFIYPHELGFLDYAFHSKIIKVLMIKKFNLDKQLLRYRIKRYFQKEGFHNSILLVISILTIAALIYRRDLEKDLLAYILITGMFLFVLSIGFFVKDIIKYFIKNR